VALELTGPQVRADTRKEDPLVDMILSTRIMGSLHGGNRTKEIEKTLDHPWGEKKGLEKVKKGGGKGPHSQSYLVDSTKGKKLLVLLARLPRGRVL